MLFCRVKFRSIFSGVYICNEIAARQRYLLKMVDECSKLAK